VVARRLLPGLIGIVVVLSAALMGSSTVLPASAESVITQVGADIDGEAASDYSGLSVSISSDGTRVAIGAPGNDDGGNNSGHTRIYEYDGIDGDADGIDGWTQLGTDIDGEVEGDNSGWSVSLSADGTRVAIGARYNDDGGDRSGHTRIYEYDGIDGDADGIDGWTQLGTDIDGEAAWDESGFSVSLSGDGTRVAIGAPYNDDVGSYAGHTRIYEYDDIDGWTQLGADIDGEAEGDYSGWSVSLSSDGTRVAIGAPDNDDGGDFSGHTRIYEYDDIDGWTQLGADINGEAAGDYSGYSVSLSSDGTRVAIGAVYNDDGGSYAGHTRIYKYSDSNGWTQVGADIDGEAANDSSGYSVSLSSDGTRVAIGASYNDDGGSNSGHTRIYRYSDSNGWTQLGSNIAGEAENDESGYSVALSSDGTRVAIGAIYNDTRIFRITAVTQDSQRESSENPGPPGIFLTLTTHTPQHSHGYTVTFGAYAIAPNSPYVVTIRNEQTGTQRVLTSTTLSPGGHLEKSTQLPQLEAGSHTITVSARSNTGAFLTLGNRIVVDGQGNIHSVSPEQLQPSIR